MDDEQMMAAAVNEDAAFQKRKALAAAEFAAKNGKLASQYGDTPVGGAALANQLEASLAEQGLKIVEAD
jgi:hypothetical protein